MRLQPVLRPSTFALHSKANSELVQNVTGERVLFSAGDIAERVDALAQAIADGPLKPDIAVPVLVGAFVFAADLLRALAKRGLDLETEFVWLRSYGRTEKAGDILVFKAPTESEVRGKTALLMDGVLESGATMERAKQLLEEAGAAAVISVVLVQKPHAARTFRPDFACFQAGAEFLYGYGMDRAGLARGLADVRVRATSD